MASLEVGPQGNLQPIPYSGQLVFTQGGTLSVQAMNPDANAADTPYTTKAYEAYYGPVDIDDAKNVFSITVESSLVRNLIGQRLERKFEVWRQTGDFPSRRCGTLARNIRPLLTPPLVKLRLAPVPGRETTISGRGSPQRLYQIPLHTIATLALTHSGNDFQPCAVMPIVHPPARS
jgi:hypothetical protein